MKDQDLFSVIQLGHPHLRRIAEPVKDIGSTTLQTLLDHLLRYAEAVQAMGIAAPQVDINQQIFILSCKPNARYPYAPDMAARCLINPEITEYSATTSKDWEGCLSLPGIRALVPRSDSINVRFLTGDGQPVETSYQGFVARVFQHEYDHLQGKVFLDRVESTQEIMMEQEWQQQIASSRR